MNKMGSNAPIGSLAKMGANAWGEVKEEGGTVLFDGVVTLEDDDEGGVIATLLGASVPTIGHYYNIIANGQTHVTYGAALADTSIAADAQACGFSVYIDGSMGSFWGEYTVGSPGDEITLTITDLGEAPFFVSPSFVTLTANGTAYVQTNGVSTFRSTNTSVATVAEGNDGQYIITGVAEGACGVHFTSADGDILYVSVEVER